MKKNIAKINLYFVPAGTLFLLLPSFATSCASLTTFLLPIQTGSPTIEGSAFSESFSNEVKRQIFPTEDGGQKWLDTSNAWWNGTNAVSYDQYLATNFAIQQSGNSNADYGYWDVDHFDGDTKTGSSYEWTIPFVRTAYLADSPAPQPDDSDADTTVDPPATEKHWAGQIASWKNLTNSVLAQTNATITNSMRTMYALIWSFIAQPAIAGNPNEDVRTTWLDALFGKVDESTANLGLNIDDKKTFYDFIFSLENLISEGGSNVQFAQNYANFAYESNNFGPGPLITSASILNSEFDEGDEFIPGIDSFLGNKAVTDLVKVDTDVADMGKQLPGSNLENWASPYVTYTLVDIPQPTPGEGEEEPKEDEKTKKISLIHNNLQVPVLAQHETVQYTFYDYLNSKSFLPSDWEIKDVNTINGKIKNSPGWKNYSKFAGTNPELTGTTFSLKAPENKFSSEVFDKINLPSDDDGETEEFPVDYALKNSFQVNPSKKEGVGAYQNQFLNFANYMVNVKNVDDTYMVEPFLTSVTNSLPLWTFYKFADEGESLTPVIDESLFKKYTIEMPDGTEDIDLAVVDVAKAYTKYINTFVNFFGKTVGHNSDPLKDAHGSPLTGKELKDRIYSLYYCYFAYADPGGKTNSSSFLSEE